MPQIKFGTDGWRGVIADDFTFDNLRRVAQAVADYYKIQLKEGKEKEREIVIGYDTRFLSSEFARVFAEVLLGNGFSVILSQTDVPTQAVSFTVVDRKLPGGVMITASHNPPWFNGVKIKAPFGGSATPEITARIESLLDKNPIKTLPWEKGEMKGLATTVNILPPYLKKVTSFLDMKIVNSAGLRVVYDPMYGVGYGCLEEILKDSNCELFTIHPKYNPGFGGINPEPIEENLKQLQEEIKKRGADLGIATDGDADRVGVVDETGRYLSPLQVFSLLLLYLVEEKEMRGKVIKTVSLGYQPERISRKFGLEWEQTPVGFKYICEKMLKEKVILGGEESGGYGYYGHLPERDGILSALLFIEMIAKKGKPLSKILEQMEKKFGRSFFKRVDFYQEKADKKVFIEKLTSNPPAALGGIPLREILTIDGVKFVMEDESWLLIRPSGTEPKVRVYAEAPREKQMERIIEEGKNLAQQVMEEIK